METYQIQEGAAVYYLTFTIIEWLPVFIAEEPCLILTDSLNFCHRQKGLRIHAFVIMPTHVHLILFDKDFDNNRLRRTLRDMRQYTGRQLSNYCDKHTPDAFKQVIHNSRRTDRTRQFWQQSRHPAAIWSESFLQSKLDYLHDTPRRKGLVREAAAWRFSSSAYWLGGVSGKSDVGLTAVNW